jgi:hypothetical protein
MGDVALSPLASANIVAEQITSQREHNGENENPHQPEETEAEDEKG